MTVGIVEGVKVDVISILSSRLYIRLEHVSHFHISPAHVLFIHVQRWTRRTYTTILAVQFCNNCHKHFLRRVAANIYFSAAY